MEGDKELAWMYRQLYSFVIGMPSSLGGLVREPPKWFKPDEENGESAIWQMVEIANKRAKEILSNAPVGQR
jgi:hypothetical protein